MSVEGRGTLATFSDCRSVTGKAVPDETRPVHGVSADTLEGWAPARSLLREADRGLVLARSPTPTHLGEPSAQTPVTSGWCSANQGAWHRSGERTQWPPSLGLLTHIHRASMGSTWKHRTPPWGALPD